MHAGIPIRANEWMHMGAKSSKVKGVGSGKQQIPSFPEPLCVGHLLTPGLLWDRCNGQRRWQILEGPGQPWIHLVNRCGMGCPVRQGKWGPRGDKGGTAPWKFHHWAIGQLEWEHDSNMVHFRYFPACTINVWSPQITWKLWSCFPSFAEVILNEFRTRYVKQR